LFNGNVIITVLEVFDSFSYYRDCQPCTDKQLNLFMSWHGATSGKQSGHTIEVDKPFIQFRQILLFSNRHCNLSFSTHDRAWGITPSRYDAF